MSAAVRTEDRQASLFALVRQHGWTTVSFQALEPGVALHGDAVGGGVAYVDTGAAWVAAGGPLAPVQQLSSLAARFVSEGSRNGRRVCFCAAEHRLEVPGLSRLRIGAQPVWDPRRWPQTVSQSKNLKEQLRRARAKTVSVRQVAPTELEAGHSVRGQLDALVELWLSTRAGPRMRFLLDVQLFHQPRERRIFVAEVGGVIVGALSAVPVYARGGWFFEDILRDPRAPNGVAETLVDAAMKAAVEEGSSHVTMGLVPLAGDIPWWLAASRWLARGFYDFDGLRRFREKLRPDAWEPVYIAYPEEELALVAVWDTLCAIMGTTPLTWARRALRGQR